MLLVWLLSVRELENIIVKHYVFNNLTHNYYKILRLKVLKISSNNHKKNKYNNYSATTTNNNEVSDINNKAIIDIIILITTYNNIIIMGNEYFVYMCLVKSL